jgi:hypothetical protein
MTALIVTRSPRDLIASQTLNSLGALFLVSVMAFAGAAARSQQAPEQATPAQETVHASSTAAPDSNLLTIWSNSGFSGAIGSVSYQICGWLPKQSTTPANFKCYASGTLEGPLAGGDFDAVSPRPLLGSKSQPNSETVETPVYELDMPSSGIPSLLAYTKKDVITSKGVTTSTTATKSLSLTQLGTVGEGIAGFLLPVPGTANLIAGASSSPNVYLINPTKMTVIALISASSTSNTLFNPTVDVDGHIALTWYDGSTSFFSSKGVAMPTIPGGTGGALADGSPISATSGEVVISRP